MQWSLKRVHVKKKNHKALFFIKCFDTFVPVVLHSSCRGDVQSDGRHDELLHATGSPTAAAGRHGPERLQHGPVPAGAHPPTNARGPHEPIW